MTGCRALRAESFFSERVTVWNGIEINRFHQAPEAARRNLRAATHPSSSMESCNEPMLLPVTQFSLNNATAPPDKIQLKHFEDEVRNWGELVSALNVFKKQAQSAESDLPCVQKGKKNFGRKNKLSRSNYLWSLSRETKSQYLVQKNNASCGWKRKKCRGCLIFKPRRKIRRNFLTCSEHDSKTMCEGNKRARSF